MNRSGFFSAFLAGFAIILMIAVLYASSARSATQSHVDETLIAQQELSKDWFLARNVYVNFASDAIVSQITSCTVSSATDYSSSVTAYWVAARAFMLATYGVDCNALLDSDLKASFEGPLEENMEVQDNAPAYALLHCKRTIGKTTLELTHPFVIRKDIRVTGPGPACTVDVYDVLGDPAGTIDVTKTFP